MVEIYWTNNKSLENLTFTKQNVVQEGQGKAASKLPIEFLWINIRARIKSYGKKVTLIRFKKERNLWRVMIEHIWGGPAIWKKKKSILELLGQQWVCLG